LIHLGFRHLDSLPDAPGAPTLRRSMEEGGQAQAQGTSPPAQGWRCAWRRSWRSYLVPSLTPLASQTLPASAAARRRAGAGGSRVLSSRQKAKTCSDFCRLADAEPTCAAAKTPGSYARSRRKPTPPGAAQRHRACVSWSAVFGPRTMTSGWTEFRGAGQFGHARSVAVLVKHAQQERRQLRRRLEAEARIQPS